MRTKATVVEVVAGDKRRKVGDGELRFPTSTLIQIATSTKNDTRGSCVATAASLSSDHVPVSCCSSNESTNELQFTDFEQEIVESRTPSRYRSDARARKRRTEIETGSASPEMITSNPSPEKLPPATEIEEFFVSAEQELHKRFKDKYNYDIVNDTPLEGRFEWVELEP